MFVSLVAAAKLLSRVRLCATPETADHWAPLSLGFSRQEHWSGLPFPSPSMKVKSESEVAQSSPTLSDPMDFSPAGSSVHVIFQARVLEWGAIGFFESGCCCSTIPNLSHPLRYFKYVYKPASIASRLWLKGSENLFRIGHRWAKASKPMCTSPMTYYF